MTAGLAGLILAWVLLAWGAQAAVPWRLPGTPPRIKRLWALAGPMLLATGALVTALHVRAHPDAAIEQRLYPLTASLPGRALAVLLPALLIASLVTTAGWRRMEDAGWRIAAGFGLAFLAAASWGWELLRVGEGPSGRLGPFVITVVCRLLISLAAGEAAAPGRPLLAVLGGLALPVYWLLLPAELAQALQRGGHLLTLGAAALLFLAARWLPAALRRPALGAATLLAGLFLAQAAGISQTMIPAPEPMPSLPSSP